MSDVNEALIQRLRALIEQRPNDLAAQVRRIGFDTNARIDLVWSDPGSDVPAAVRLTLDGDIVELAVPEPLAAGPIAEPETNKELQS